MKWFLILFDENGEESEYCFNTEEYDIPIPRVDEFIDIGDKKTFRVTQIYTRFEPDKKENITFKRVIVYAEQQ